MANFINAADRVVMPIAIIQMTDQFKWDLHGQGWVLSAFAVGYMSSMVGIGPGGHVKNTYELLNLRVRKVSPVNKIHIFQCMGRVLH